ncbi:hypothetical protein J7E97_02320 [Streptomyces sp. ISL-66]|nr:hypothetical protein [Streptomyces sp. ISL-66]MBT2466732.1 hypothetical protein [Streptomyces sp. ISL-66]
MILTDPHAQRSAPPVNTADACIPRPPLAHLPAQGGPAEGPLTSEPPLADSAHAPLTSEPPLTDEAPLTSEPTTSAAAAAAGD